MICIVMGTSGSGKSTLARDFMAEYNFDEGRQPDRRQPIYYRATSLTDPDIRGNAAIFVLGHYETACGGADTIKTPDQLFALLCTLDREDSFVFAEGVLLYSYVNRILKLREDNHDVRVVGLTEVTMDECLRGIADRRAAKGNAKPIDDRCRDNARAKARGTDRSLERLREAKVHVYRCNREQGLSIVRSLAKEIVS